MIMKIRTIIQVLLVLIFLLCAVFVFRYFYNAKQSQDSFAELKELVKKETTEDITDNYIPKRAENGMLEAYYELYTRNNDMSGWINIPDTSIDYPVVQYSDNNFYLHRDFNKKHQSSGIPFLDFQCSENSSNDIIYAHNMKNGSMFASLTKYDNKAFYETHKQLIYDTVYDKGRYMVFAVFTTTVGSKNEFKYYEYTDMDKEHFDEYVKKAKELSLYETGITPTYGDRLLTLSTCAYHTSDERFVVVAKRIKY